MVVPLVSIFAAFLTFFSGFGLGTILLPAFALFFSLEEAIAMTAIVHLLNNFFKLFLVGKHAVAKIVFTFGIPAIIMAYLGAQLFYIFQGLEPLASYQLGGITYVISTDKLVIALLIIFFSLFDIIPIISQIKFPAKYIPFGGILSGFFGGFSGHQGAFRSTFLIKLGLSKEAFIATGVIIACMIDITRLSVYGYNLSKQLSKEIVPLLILATSSAFLGVIFGKKILTKITQEIVQRLVGFLMIIIAFLLGFGII